MKIDKFKRYQSGLSIVWMFPIRNDKRCACNCGDKLSGRRTRWATNDCQEKSLEEFLIVKGDIRIIRHAIVKREYSEHGGVYCHGCGENLQKLFEDWHADHILEVRHGGGACGLENFQPLCQPCHKNKTLENHTL